MSEAAALLQEFNSQRKSVRELEENIVTTRRKLNENYLAIKRAMAVLEEVEANPPKRTFTQAGQAFTSVEPQQLVENLKQEIEKNTKQRSQLTDVEARFVERLKNKKGELQALEGKIRKIAIPAN